MIFLYISLILFLAGVSCWISGAVLFKKSAHLEKKARKKKQQKALRVGSISKIILVVASLFFILGIMMLYGVQMSR